MSDLFDFQPKTDYYAVMGNPIAHSKSPLIHQRFAQQTGQHLEYSAIQVDPGGFAQAAGNFGANGGKGFNVTVPFKQDAWQWVTTRSPAAEIAGAVNTVTLHADGSSHGDNTDGVGLVRDLRQNLNVDPAGKRILILGAGGAVRGVIVPLLEQHPAAITIANRTPDKAQELAVLFTAYGPVNAVGYSSIPAQTFDLIINGTAASLQGEVPSLPAAACDKNTLGYDMMYGAQPTAFMNWCRARGAHAVDGLGMLVEQAAESFYIWRRVRPDTVPVLGELRQSLQ